MVYEERAGLGLEVTGTRRAERARRGVASTGGQVEMGHQGQEKGMGAR